MDYFIKRELLDMRIKNKLFAESWNVAWRKKKEGILENKYSQFYVIDNSYRYWAADPFIIEYDNEVFIFAELYDYIHRKGIIGYCTMYNTKWVPIIKEEYHLSYPFLFKKDDDIYILPEANENGELYLYRAIKFPDKWEKEKILRKNVRYVDTTLLSYKNQEYALTYDIEDKDHPSLKMINLSDESKDEVLPVNDINQVRPAGKFFKVDSELYRPAQNCVDGYGKGLLIYKITFDGEDYSEVLESRIETSDLNLSKKLFCDGIHTYNSSEHYEVIDIKTKRFNLLDFICRFLGKMKR